jgi:hypothetical protein
VCVCVCVCVLELRNKLRPSSGKVNNTERPAFRPPHVIMGL